MKPKDVIVQVRNADLERVGTITPKNLDLEANLYHNSVGDWKVTLPRRHPMTPYLSQPGSGIVVSCRVDDLPATPEVWGPGPSIDATNLVTNPEGAGAGSVEVFRNRIRNPKTASGAGGYAPYAATESFAGGRYRMTATAAVNCDVWPEAPATEALGGRFAVTIGDLFAWRVEVHNPNAFDLYVCTQSRWYDAAGAGIGGYITGAWTLVAPGASIVVEATGTVPSIAGLAGMLPTLIFASSAAGAAVSIGTLMDFTDWALYTGVIPQGSPVPFSYGTVSHDPDLTAAWQGTVNNSATILSGVPVTGYTAVNGVMIRSSQWAAQGTHSMRLVSKSSTALCYATQTVASITAPQTLTLYRRQEGVITWVSGATYNGTAYVVPAGPTSATNVAPNVAGVSTLHVTTSEASPTIVLYGNQVAGESIWFDVMTRVAGDYTGPPFSGATVNDPGPGPGYAYDWTGTVDASTSNRRALVVTTPAVPATPQYETLFSGPTSTPTKTRNKRNPDGTFTFSGVTDDVILWDARCWPQPSNPNVSTQTQGYYVSSALNAETVLRDLVNKNIGPGAPLARRGRLAQALTFPANGNRGPAAIKSVRFPKLGVALGEVAAFAELGFRVVQVGTNLSFEVRELTDRTGTVRLDMRNGTITSEESKTSPPTITRALVAGQGEGAERTIRAITTTEATDAEVEWGRVIEEFIDQRQTDDPDELDQAGMERLLEGGFTATAVKVIPGEDTTMRFVSDWNLGERVSVIIDGQRSTAAVTAASIKIGPKRSIVGVAIGDVSRFTDQSATVRRLNDTSRRVEALERTAEAGTDPLVSVAALDAALALLMPPGRVIAQASTAVGPGFLLCDGQAVSRTTYAALFAAIGTVHGVGNGTTTFNVPDYRGMTLVSRDSGQTEFNAIGKVGGSKTHKHTLTQVIAALWQGAMKVRTNPLGSWSITNSNNYTIPGGGSGSYNTGVAIEGETGASSNLQPYRVINYLIKT